MRAYIISRTYKQAEEFVYGTTALVDIGTISRVTVLARQLEGRPLPRNMWRFVELVNQLRGIDEGDFIFYGDWHQRLDHEMLSEHVYMLQKTRGKEKIRVHYL